MTATLAALGEHPPERACFIVGTVEIRCGAQRGPLKQPIEAVRFFDQPFFRMDVDSNLVDQPVCFQRCAFAQDDVTNERILSLEERCAVNGALQLCLQIVAQIQRQVHQGTSLVFFTS